MPATMVRGSASPALTRILISFFDFGTASASRIFATRSSTFMKSSMAIRLSTGAEGWAGAGGVTDGGGAGGAAGGGSGGGRAGGGGRRSRRLGAVIHVLLLCARPESLAFHNVARATDRPARTRL